MSINYRLCMCILERIVGKHENKISGQTSPNNLTKFYTHDPWACPNSKYRVIFNYDPKGGSSTPIYPLKVWSFEKFIKNHRKFLETFGQLYGIPEKLYFNLSSGLVPIRSKLWPWGAAENFIFVHLGFFNITFFSHSRFHF